MGDNPFAVGILRERLHYRDHKPRRQESKAPFCGILDEQNGA
jgi:hypothetical protein